MSRVWLWRIALATSIAGLATIVLLVAIAVRSETLFIVLLEACFVILGSLGWVWFEDRCATAPDRRRRRELAKAFPSARAVRVRVDGWHRERLDINPALDRATRRPR